MKRGSSRGNIMGRQCFTVSKTTCLGMTLLLFVTPALMNTPRWFLSVLCHFYCNSKIAPIASGLTDCKTLSTHYISPWRTSFHQITMRVLVADDMFQYLCCLDIYGRYVQSNSNFPEYDHVSPAVNFTPGS
jgi:hypothetical protein